MKRRRSLCSALVALHLLIAPNKLGAMNQPNDVSLTPQPSAFAAQRIGKVGVALADARRLLREGNSCSQFFGGSEASLEVLAQLSAKLREEKLENPQIGIRMSGGYENVISLLKRFSYRIFDHSVVNTRGPFFSLGHDRDMRVSMVGSFHGDSREVRALMLLHELGHLIKGADGKWLLPDDAGDHRRGHLNTLTIERHCGKLIRQLRKTKPDFQPEPSMQTSNQVAKAQFTEALNSASQPKP